MSWAAVGMPTAKGGPRGLGPVGRVTIDLLRWPALGMGLIAGLAVLCRYGPDRAEPKWRWVTPGCAPRDDRVVLVGAELNAELERQTLRDSMRGPDRPLGQRNANVADTVGAAENESLGRDRA